MMRYERYRKTGIAWLPEVPEGWEMVRNKTFLSLTDEKVGARKDEFTLLSLTKQGVIVRDLTEMKGKFPKDFDTYLVVRPGNLVFCLFDVDETPRTVGLVKNVGMLTGAYTNFNVNDSLVLPDFACYYYLHVDDAKKLRPYYTGLRKVVKTNTFLQLRFPRPSLPVQHAIVSFLDSKCGKIDRLVAAKMKESTLLKELKQSMIAEAVTGRMAVESRATRNDRKMRPSGIPWLPEVPVGWEVKRNKACFTNEKRVVGAASADTQLLSLTTRGIKEKDGDNLSGKLPESFDGYQYVVPDDLVMCLFDLDCSAVFSGISRYYGMISPAYRILKCRNVILPCYADLWFRYISQGRKFKQYSKSLRYTLTIDEFGALPIVVPPLAEQREIVAYIETRAAKIDAAVGKLEAEVTALKEYRERLVADVVTGQRKVA